MSLKLRLARAGTKKRPYYHIVRRRCPLARATAASSKRSAPMIRCWPMTASASTLNAERATHWLSVGAQPTDRVLRFLDAAGLLKRDAAQQPRARQAGQEGHRARRSPRQGRCRQGRRCGRSGRRETAQTAPPPQPSPQGGGCCPVGRPIVPRATCRLVGEDGRGIPMAEQSQSLLMGRIGAAHGIKGEVRIQSFTEEPLALAELRAADAPTSPAS